MMKPNNIQHIRQTPDIFVRAGTDKNVEGLPGPWPGGFSMSNQYHAYKSE